MSARFEDELEVTNDATLRAIRREMERKNLIRILREIAATRPGPNGDTVREQIKRLEALAPRVLR